MTKPYYSRFSQVGNDENGFPTGSQDNVLGRDKGWKQLQFISGRHPQTPELNELQEILNEKIRLLGDRVMRNGQFLGLTIRIDKLASPKKAYIEWTDPAVPGLVYAFGDFHIVQPATLNITGIGLESVAVRIVKSIVTELEDPTLYNPVVGEETLGGPGAYRWTFTADPVIKNDSNREELADAFDLWVLQDAEVRTASNDALNDVDRNLIDYTNDITGNTLIRGMRVRVEDKGDQLRVVVDRGRAYVGGRRTGYDTTTTLEINKAKFDTRTVPGELIHSASQLSGTDAIFETNYETGDSPISTITKLQCLTAVSRKGNYYDYPFTVNPADPLEIFIDTNFPFGPIFKVVAVYDANTDAPINVELRARSFKFTGGYPSGQIRVVWVYNATLQDGTDFTVNLGNRESFDFLRQYPAALNNGTAINTLTDRAQFMFPGISSTKLTAAAAISDDILSFESNHGILVGQTLRIGNTRTTADEEVTVAEILAGNQVRIDPALTANHAIDTTVYVDADFVGVPLSSNIFPISVDYRWMLDRIDVVYIDIDNNIVVQSGQSNKPAYPPAIPQGVLPLTQLRLTANGDAADVVIVPYRVKSQTQQELQNLLKRVEDGEYRDSILQLQLQTYNKAAAGGLALRGILTDAYVNSDVIEITKNPAAFRDVMIDPERGRMSPRLNMDNLTLTVDTAAANTTCFVGAKSACLGHTLIASTVIVNNTVTFGPTNTKDTERIRGLTNTPKPTLVVKTGHYLGPAEREATFKFFNAVSRATDTVPRDIEGGFWRTRQARVPWLEQQNLFLPPLTLTLSGRNFPAGTYKVAIDGRVLKDNLSADITVTINATGAFVDVPVVVQAVTVSGHNSRTVQLLGAGDAVVASTLFGATPSEAVFLPTSNDSLAANPFAPVVQTFGLTRDTFFRGVKVFFDSVGTSWVEFHVVETDENGTPTGRVLASKRVLNDGLIPNLRTDQGNDIFFDDVVFGEAGKSYGIAMIAPDDNFVLAKAVVGHADEAGVRMTAKPIATGAIYTSVDGTSWVIQTESCLQFALLECSFIASQNKLSFLPVGSLTIPAIPMMIARVQQLVPRGAAVDWSYTIDNTVTEIGLQVDVDGSLDPQALPRTASTVTLKAVIRGPLTSNNISGVVGTTNARILVFDAKPMAIYPTRDARGLPLYKSARVTLQRLAQMTDSALKVKFAMVDDPYGVVNFTLSGVPASGDTVTITQDGTPFVFTYNPSGSPSLSDLAAALVSAYTTAMPAYEITQVVVGSDRRVTITRRSGQAFVDGDVTCVVVPTGGSTLATGAVSANYKLMVKLPGQTLIDEEFTEVVYELGTTESATPNLTPPAVAGTSPATYMFRVQVEVLTQNQLLYPQTRGFAVVVSN